MVVVPSPAHPGNQTVRRTPDKLVATPKVKTRSSRVASMKFQDESDEDSTLQCRIESGEMGV